VSDEVIWRYRSDRPKRDNAIAVAARFAAEYSYPPRDLDARGVRGAWEHDGVYRGRFGLFMGDDEYEIRGSREGLWQVRRA
jgi:hypothetical protein